METSLNSSTTSLRSGRFSKQNTTLGDFQKNELQAKKDKALNSQREKLIHNMMVEKASQEQIPAGTSIVNKLTGDAAQLLHQEKERHREKLREQVINSFHQQKENRIPSARSQFQQQRTSFSK